MQRRVFFSRTRQPLRRAVTARRGALAAAVGACALIALQAPARADLIWNFSYSATVDVNTTQSNPPYPSGAMLQASGQLTTTDNLVTGALGSYYQITGITGTYNGMAMSLIPVGGYYNDNLLYPAGTTYPKGSYLDGSGFSFVAGGMQINVYADTTAGKYDEVVDYDNTDTYEVTDNGTFTVSPAQSAVPEPASLAVFGAALVGFGLIRRRKRA